MNGKQHGPIQISPKWAHSFKEGGGAKLCKQNTVILVCHKITKYEPGISRQLFFLVLISVFNTHDVALKVRRKRRTILKR